MAWAAASPSAICRPMRTISGDFQRAGAVEPLLERLAGDELHHQIGQRLFLDGMHLDDVLMANLGRGPGFPQEALAGRRSGGDRAAPAP